MRPLLEVKGLKTYFFTDDGVMPAVDGIDFVLNKNEILGIVGESGCGKTQTALSIMRLIQSPPGDIVSGEILFEGEDLLKKSQNEMYDIRGNDISMIFQEPMTSLNPVYTIGNQIEEAITLHQKLKREEVRNQIIKILKLVGIPSPEHCIGNYPHRLSGGMRQRAMIAMALSCNPKLLIADEPTTALDVTIQAQILALMQEIHEQYNMPILLITHDLGIVSEIVEKVIVMYCGKIVEKTDVYQIFSRPLHPYTIGLMKAIPQSNNESKELHVIRGMVPGIGEIPKGCRFHNRCNMAEKKCSVEAPPLKEVIKNHYVACWPIQEGKNPIV